MQHRSWYEMKNGTAEKRPDAAIGRPSRTKATKRRGNHMSSIYGYARVSTRDQNLDRQLDALAESGVDQANVFMDKASGKDFERPEYQRLLRVLRPEDVIVIKSIDRLGRNYD